MHAAADLEDEDAALPPLDLSTLAVQRRTVFASTVLHQCARFSSLCCFDVFLLEGPVQSWLLADVIPTFEFALTDGCGQWQQHQQDVDNVALWALLTLVGVAAVAMPDSVGLEWTNAATEIGELMDVLGENEESLRDCVKLFLLVDPYCF